ncbi:UDP-N-acetylmuramate dehydrogenase [Christiangramia flava]|uniref:UDP-N-acetylenolpyruvoylglucosamine reductase n=1 Tax=Christiangramia flava JLT2011 TaxID=1229726 RepID=A0A1L7I2I2_9FLAO|nr:UDP-N-acetylmuramate dehydrogenase [Christiangramia flava]APU67393.1 UDP-N-acetylenolpyruvoylglucosamine reductase [Christiangramia flava JLT2011]OSS39978.1 UDP-N-acetylenolpyruvoylglucosamine reductase [Christiangramia flava JLT2011]
MQLLQNFSLKNYNTFGIDVKAERFVSVTSIEELKTVLRRTYADDLFILGGGSNMLLTHDIQKTVVHISLTGKKIISQTEEEVIVEGAGGENWHDFVRWTLSQDYGGLENMSLIPGNVGTSPIQNIGAYGVELKDCFVSCEAMNVQTLEVIRFNLEDCDFGYRNSVFKNQLKHQFIITSVQFHLSKKNHRIHSEYGAIQAELDAAGIEEPSIQDISEAVIKIRRSKLPDPAKIGNSGSFFKNPVISLKTYNKIKEEWPELPCYKISEEEVKVPAGWLIDQAGLKGYREGDAGVHEKQALVLVNYGKATGNEILELARKVQHDVHRKFHIELEPEVNII